MPRPRSPAYDYAALVVLLGPPAHERASFTPPAGAPALSREKIHHGWLWVCGCAAFARPAETDAYLLVACVLHDRPAGASARKPVPPPPEDEPQG